ncbi:hypothetical protein L7F22_043547 [Adiantum nelumboides]|nr:hypothetical protein [Adiantum nelumboides]
MRAGSNSITAKGLLLLLLTLGFIQAKDLQTNQPTDTRQGVIIPNQDTIQHIPSNHSNTNASHKSHHGFFNLATSAVGSLMENVEHMIDDFLPIDVDESSVLGGGGFGDDGTTLAWGGSTLEVVKTQASYLTRAAAFGPKIVDEQGIRGTLLPISDFYRLSRKEDQEIVEESIEKQLAIINHGCPYKGGPGWRDDDEQNGSMTDFEQINVEKITSKPPSDWIALVERGGNCSFVAKVRVAQALGAEAVVVGDAPSENGGRDGQADNDPGLSGQLVTMYAPGDTSDVLIPSTFVTRPSYVDLIRLIDEQDQEDQKACSALKKEGKECATHKTGLKVILWRDDIMWEWPLIDLAFVLLMLPSLMTLVTIIIHRFRMIRQRRRERAPEIAVLNLPCLIWRGNGQPWEKVEDAQMVGDQSGTKDSNSNTILSRTIAKIITFWNRMRGGQTRPDMELGGNNGEISPSPSTDEAGPSTLPTCSSANGTIKPLKTVPVAPPAPPPDRTYYSCDECAICLSDFVDGDLVRVLPCGHVFHLPEIDSWLTRVKKFCPICKRDITVIPPPAPPIPGTTNATATATSPSMVPNEEQENENESLLIPNRQV